MMIATLVEEQPETRVAITPFAVKHYTKLGFEVGIEKKAGVKAGFSDDDYKQAGAQVFTKKELLKKTHVLLCINEPSPEALTGLPSKALVVGHLEQDPESALTLWANQHHINLLSMNLIPRITRAQSMDSLSSQANLAGYKAVLEAVNAYQRVVPMMMTAAGMIKPAKVLILGAGVAGLQAIATAKRLGAVVYAFDVRSAAKEQVESLGAEFIEVAQNEESETKGGYASEMSEEYKAKQAQLIDDHAKQCDMVITTALIPGRKAPVLLYKKTVEAMKPGSVIVDIATSRGGNCELSKANQTIKVGEVTIIGISNMAGLVPTTASELYANNLVHLLELLTNKQAEIHFNPEDELIQQAVLCHEGRYLPFKTEPQHA